MYILSAQAEFKDKKHAIHIDNLCKDRNNAIEALAMRLPTASPIAQQCSGLEARRGSLLNFHMDTTRLTEKHAQMIDLGFFVAVGIVGGWVGGWVGLAFVPDSGMLQKSLAAFVFQKKPKRMSHAPQHRPREMHTIRMISTQHV